MCQNFMADKCTSPCGVWATIYRGNPSLIRSLRYNHPALRVSERLGNDRKTQGRACDWGPLKFTTSIASTKPVVGRLRRGRFNDVLIIYNYIVVSVPCLCLLSACSAWLWNGDVIRSVKVIFKVHFSVRQIPPNVSSICVFRTIIFQMCSLKRCRAIDIFIG